MHNTQSMFSSVRIIRHVFNPNKCELEISNYSLVELNFQNIYIDIYTNIPLFMPRGTSGERAGASPHGGPQFVRAIVGLLRLKHLH